MIDRVFLKRVIKPDMILPLEVPVGQTKQASFPAGLPHYSLQLSLSSLGDSTAVTVSRLRVSGWAPNWARFSPNGTNLGLFKISFSTFWLGEPKCTETNL